jgi:hypothetical protein
MSRLLFISRVAFICNICMIVAWLMRYADPLRNTTLQSTVIIAGFLLAVIFNLIALIWVILLVMRGLRNIPDPAWLFIINFLCFAFQIYLFAK